MFSVFVTGNCVTDRTLFLFRNKLRFFTEINLSFDQHFLSAETSHFFRLNRMSYIPNY